MSDGGHFVTCPACRGEGPFTAFVNRGDGGCTVERIPCSFCKGTGDVYEVQARKYVEGRKLSEARIAAGRSLREFATLLGLTPARMSDIEHGREGANYLRLHERLRDWV